MKEYIPKLKGYNCFACGTENPIGLNLQFYKQEDYICSDITLEKNYEGWANMAHGGIISTLLDEIMSWALIYFKKTFPVTKSIKLKYIKPVPLQKTLTVKGTLLKTENNGVCRAKGVVKDENGNTLAIGDGQFVMLTDKDLYLVPEKLKQDMKDLFVEFNTPE